jgi:Amt family ammonium transporter
LYDAGSLCNGCLAGLVAITAPCDIVDQWAAVVIGIIGGIFYSIFSKIILKLNIDDPIEATAVHYINGVWGIIACAVFDRKRGFVAGSNYEEGFLGIQMAGIVAVSAWSVAWCIIIMLPCYLTNWHKYHPAVELLGVGILTMGELTQKIKDGNS